MNIALGKPLMTQDQFFDWAEAQDTRYEFYGFQPLAMAGGSINHNRVAFNIHTALRRRLNGSGCEALGLDAGVATIGDAVRYPDAVVTCSQVHGDSRLVPNPVFEVVSPTSGRMDRIVKLREYAAVPTILRHVIVKAASIGLTALERRSGDKKWTVTTLLADDTLQLPEIGIEVPVKELYSGLELQDLDADIGPPDDAATSDL